MQPSRLGKHEIHGTLGRGAMGTVLDGWDPAIQRRVAIKTMRLVDRDRETRETLARFRRETQAAGRLSQPNIVAIHDVGEAEDLAYLVTEFVDGEPLKAVLDCGERFAVPELLRVMDGVLAGLAYCHARGVVHRATRVRRGRAPGYGAQTETTLRDGRGVRPRCVTLRPPLPAAATMARRPRSSHAPRGAGPRLLVGLARPAPGASHGGGGPEPSTL